MDDSTDYTYVGSELEVFAKAVHWKRYFSSHLAAYLRGDVLEVGAGIGANTPFLRVHASHAHWFCLEPDGSMVATLKEKFADDSAVTVLQGAVSDLPKTQTFDTILYLDVLEHIAQDGEELCRATSHLRHHGALIVLAPAHQALYTEFDKAIGHYRRYRKATLAALTPPGTTLVKLLYLDTMGLAASCSNRMFLHQAQPSEKQIRMWDTLMVPLSRILDPLLAYRLGKTLLGVWQKD